MQYRNVERRNIAEALPDEIRAVIAAQAVRASVVAHRLSEEPSRRSLPRDSRSPEPTRPLPLNEIDTSVSSDRDGFHYQGPTPPAAFLGQVPPGGSGLEAAARAYDNDDLADNNNNNNNDDDYEQQQQQHAQQPPELYQQPQNTFFEEHGNSGAHNHHRHHQQQQQQQEQQQQYHHNQSRREARSRRRCDTLVGDLQGVRVLKQALESQWLVHYRKLKTPDNATTTAQNIIMRGAKQQTRHLQRRDKILMTIFVAAFATDDQTAKFLPSIGDFLANSPPNDVALALHYARALGVVELHTDPCFRLVVRTDANTGLTATQDDFITDVICCLPRSFLDNMESILRELESGSLTCRAVPVPPYWDCLVQ